jgi:hypothetical protein
MHTRTAMRTRPACSDLRTEARPLLLLLPISHLGQGIDRLPLALPLGYSIEAKVPIRIWLGLPRNWSMGPRLPNLFSFYTAGFALWLASVCRYSYIVRPLLYFLSLNKAD